MKKSLLTLFAALVSLSALAADMPRQGFGIQVGFAQPILRLNSSSNPQAPTVSGGDFNKETFGLGNKTRLNGIKVGVVYDASYVKGFGSSIGINYTYASGTPGWEACTYDLYNVKEKRTWYKYHELELFADWQYKFEVAKETYISNPTTDFETVESREQLHTSDHIYTVLGAYVGKAEVFDSLPSGIYVLNGVKYFKK